MKSAKRYLYKLSALVGMLAMIPSVFAAAAPADDAVQVTTIVTASVNDGKRMPPISPGDVIVHQGKDRLRVTEWVPAQGTRAGLELFVLIDDASDARLGSHIADLKDFINRQPSSTSIGVGYMRNAGVQVVQDLTLDHARAARAIRLPMGSSGAYGNPWLSASDVMRRWPASDNRREIVMITDGIDRSGRNGRAMGRGMHLNPDVDVASSVAQRTGTVVHTIYMPGRGRRHHHYWTAMSGQTDMTRLSAKTGGESYYLGLGNPVSLSPYLNRLEKVLNNQYLLSFSTAPGKKPRLQSVSLNTQVAGVRLAAADAVWVPGPEEAVR